MGTHTWIAPPTGKTPRERNERWLVAALASVVAGAFVLCSVVGVGRAQAPSRSFDLLEATIPELQAALAAGAVTSRDLVAMYLARIDAYDQKGPALNAISAVKLGYAYEQATRHRWPPASTPALPRP
jgi:hypothetical protein